MSLDLYPVSSSSNMHTFLNTLATETVQKYDIVDKPFHIPALPKAQCIVVPIVREVIAPLIVRNNASDEITEQYIADENRVRMIASKTKGVERRRGAQILRSLGKGGVAAANKAYISKKSSPGNVFDLNTFVYGDSGKGGEKAIYPVHAAVLYSDALSVQAKSDQIESTFRQGGVYEDGGNFDAESGSTSSNIFTTYTVKPGTLFIQTAVFLGNRITRAAFDHWLLSIGLAGAYGGTTATTGTNIKTHLAGIYWGMVERAINAPGEILSLVSEESVEDLLSTIEDIFAKEYPNSVGCSALNEYLNQRVKELEARERNLIEQYTDESHKVKEMFDKWFLKS